MDQGKLTHPDNNRDPEEPRRLALRLIPFEETLPAAFPTRVYWAAKLSREATMAEWLHYWLEEVVLPKREATTSHAYECIIRVHLVPAMGKVRLCDVTPSLLQSYYDWIGPAKGLSNNTVRKHHILLHTSLGLAYRQGLLSSNPADRVSPPKSVPPRQTFYNTEQLACLLQMLHGNTLELPVRLACYLGLRRSEITGLRWQDIDLVHATVSVREVRTAIGVEVIKKTPKTLTSMRTLSIAGNEELQILLASTLQARKERGERNGIPWSEEDLVVETADGLPMNPNTLTTLFHRFIRANHLPKITLHGLRHTFASIANDEKMSMFQISKTLGHSDPGITARIYTHVFDQTHGEVLAAVAQAIPGDVFSVYHHPEGKAPNSEGPEVSSEQA